MPNTLVSRIVSFNFLPMRCAFRKYHHPRFRTTFGQHSLKYFLSKLFNNFIVPLDLHDVSLYTLKRQLKALLLWYTYIYFNLVIVIQNFICFCHVFFLHLFLFFYNCYFTFLFIFSCSRVYCDLASGSLCQCIIYFPTLSLFVYIHWQIFF